MLPALPPTFSEDNVGVCERGSALACLARVVHLQSANGSHSTAAPNGLEMSSICRWRFLSDRCLSPCHHALVSGASRTTRVRARTYGAVRNLVRAHMKCRHYYRPKSRALSVPSSVVTHHNAVACLRVCTARSSYGLSSFDGQRHEPHDHSHPLPATHSPTLARRARRNVHGTGWRAPAAHHMGGPWIRGAHAGQPRGRGLPLTCRPGVSVHNASAARRPRPVRCVQGGAVAAAERCRYARQRTAAPINV